MKHPILKMRPILAVAVAVICIGCEQKLTKEEADVLDAFVFVTEGFEENTIEKYILRPWKRTVTGRSIEYATLRNNSIGWSDPETNAKTRLSKFIKLSETVSAIEKCVIRRKWVQDWSKGGSDTEFGAYTIVDEQTFDLNKAYRFEIVLDRPTADPHLEGPAVACSPDAHCSNEWSKQIFPEDYYSYDVRSPTVLRRDKALELIKKACPGKPY